MSLLMDALKKAERAKRGQAGEGTGTATNPAITPAGSDSGSTPAPADTLSLEPLSIASPDSPTPATNSAPSPLPPVTDLPAQLEALDEAFLAEIEKTARQPNAASNTGNLSIAPLELPKRTAASAARPAPAAQAAAQNLFAAKQPAAAPANNRALLMLGGLAALAAVGIGGYFWWQLQPRSSTALLTPPLAVSPAPTFAPPPQPIAPSPSMAPPIASATPAAPTTEAEADDAPDDTADDTADNTPPAPKSPPPAVASEERIVYPSKTPLRVVPALQRGYEAFNRGDLAAARAEYNRARQADPNSPDALHGLAAIALREGQSEQAASLYQRLLEANPQDAVAQAALINLRGQLDPAVAEDRLKSLAAAQPALAAPEFSLGNLYARQGRWAEAQQAYFRAYTAEADNPDILYNLAISLEHIGQPRLAARYYAQALAAMKTRPAAFDPAQAEARLRALQP